MNTHIGLKIKELAGRKNLSLVDIAKTLGKTKQSIYEMVEKEDVNTKIIKQLSEAYGVPVAYFFDEYTPQVNNIASGNNSVATVSHSGNVKNDSVEVLRERVKSLERDVKLLENLVAEKERLINVLMDRKN